MSANLQNPIPDPAAEPETPLPLPDWLVELNRQLGSLAAASAEQAFGMGCTTSLVPMLIVLVVAFILGVRHWVTLSIIALILVLLATVWAVFVAYQAHGRSLRRSWQDTIHPAFEQGILERQVSEEEARETALSVLPAQAALCRALQGGLDETHNDQQNGTSE